MPPPLAASAKNLVPMIGPAGTAHSARVHSPVLPRAMARGGAKSGCRSAACAVRSASTISFQSSTCWTVSSDTNTVLPLAMGDSLGGNDFLDRAPDREDLLVGHALAHQGEPDRSRTFLVARHAQRAAFKQVRDRGVADDD